MNHTTLNHLALAENVRREILHRSDFMPPLPDLVVRLLGVLGKKETEPKDLERLLQNDMVLVAKMLTMVNSPFYGLNRTIRSVKDAVMVLGFRGVRSLVLATSAAKFLQSDSSCYGHEPKGLWSHAVSVAAGARLLSLQSKLGPDEAEQLFVTGLLHDIGKFLLAPYLFDALKGRAVVGATTEVERDLIGIDHTEAGALVVAKWNLAEAIQEGIELHHAIDGPATKSTAVVRLADAVAHELGYGYLPGRAPAALVRSCDLAALGLGQEAWSAQRDALAATMAGAVSALANLSA